MRRTIAFLCVSVLAAAAAAAQSKTVTKAGEKITVVATIQQIDSTARQITFRNADGSEDTVTAGPDVQRFNELKVGDKVTFTYYESKVFQLRKSGMNQRLALLMIEIDQFGRRVGRQETNSDDVKRISDRAAEIATDLHRLSYQLHPTKLEALGLVPSVQAVCRDVSSQHGIQVEFKHQFVPTDLHPEIALCLFRIVQESLRNVVRHSHATRVLVKIAATDGELHLQVADQGCGFDVDAMGRNGLGLVSMRERVKFVGGEIAIRSAPGNGTRIGVRVPCTVAQTAETVEESAADRSKTA